MKILEELISFGSKGSRKAQVFAFGGIALLAGPSLKLDPTQTHVFAGLCGVYILGRALHDYGTARAG